jgi:hypothetical protein
LKTDREGERGIERGGPTPRDGMGDEKAKETPGPLSMALHTSPILLLFYSPVPKPPMKDKAIL